MGAWELPTSIEIDRSVYEIRSDYRAIIDILLAFNDRELNEIEKYEVALKIFYVDQIPDFQLEKACEKMVEFINFMKIGKGRDPRKLMDWEQDADLIIPAVNKVAGSEIRLLPYLHWWTFLGMYMEVGDCLFSQILAIRQKKAQGIKLEKWELEFFKANKDLIELRNRKEERSKEEQDELRKLFGMPEKR